MGRLKSGNERDSIRTRPSVDIIQNADQHSGNLTRRALEILTDSLTHPHGIEVPLEDGRVGRVTVNFDSETDRTGNGSADTGHGTGFLETHTKNHPNPKDGHAACRC